MHMRRLYQKLPQLTRPISNRVYYFEGTSKPSDFNVKGELTVTGSDSEKVLMFNANGLPDIVPSSGTVISKRSGDDKHGQLMPTSASGGPISLLGPFPTANYASDSKENYQIDVSVAVANLIKQQPFFSRGALNFVKNALGISDNEKVTGTLTPKR
jgi:hypothetical protein